MAIDISTVEQSPFKMVPLNLDKDKMRGPVLLDRKKDNLRVIVRRGDDIIIPDDKAPKLVESGFRALELARKISPEFPTFVSMSGKRFNGYMNVTMHVSQEMVEDMPDSQSAAILHELVENLQEDEHFTDGSIDSLPQLAEFLFTGETRIPYFRHLHDQFAAGKEGSHPQGWGRAVEILLGERSGQDWEQAFGAVLEKRKLSEDEKIKVIKDAIEIAKASPV